MQQLIRSLHIPKYMIENSATSGTEKENRGYGLREESSRHSINYVTRQWQSSVVNTITVAPPLP